MGLSRCMFAFVLFGLLVAAGEAAEPNEAPLGETKKALQGLRHDQTSRELISPEGKLHDLLPAIAAPGEGLPTSKPYDPRQKEADLKKGKASQKNWLLSGVDKLDPKHKTTDSKDQPASDSESESKSVDDRDPNYLLSLYTEQASQSDPKAEKESPRLLQSSEATASLMQSWLSNSPGNGKTGNGFPIGSESRQGIGMAATAQRSDEFVRPQVLSDFQGYRESRAGGTNEASVHTNPYLSVNSLAGLDQTLGAPSRAVETLIPVSPRSQPPAAQVLPVLPEERKAPAPLGSDDKKYFPQLKKF